MPINTSYHLAQVNGIIPALQIVNVCVSVNQFIQISLIYNILELVTRTNAYSVFFSTKPHNLSGDRGYTFKKKHLYAQ